MSGRSLCSDLCFRPATIRADAGARVKRIPTFCLIPHNTSCHGLIPRQSFLHKSAGAAVPSVIAERRLRAWAAIEQCAADPRRGACSIPRLCQETGVSARTLHNVCREFGGRSVKAYVTQRRLQLAVEMLDRAQAAQTTVTNIATFCGFTHLGRFSKAVRNNHGHLPSLILRRVPDLWDQGL